MPGSTEELPPLAGRVALVTGVGSSEGIGFAIARQLLRYGASVGITSTTDRVHDRARELGRDGGSVSAQIADLTDRTATRRIIDAVEREHGPIEILINNAGMTQIGDRQSAAPVHELEPSAWDRQI